MILFLLLSSSQIRASDLVDQSFIDFVRFVSNTSKTNIIVDENVNSRFSIVLPKNYENNVSLDLFFSVLSKHNLEPVYVGNTLYVKKLSDGRKFYSVDLFFELPESIIKALSSNYPDIKFSSIQKSIAFKCDTRQFNEIKQLVEVLDRPRPQRKLKVIMISYNDSDLKEYGSKISAQHSGTSSFGLTSIINSLVLGNTLTFSDSRMNLSIAFSALDSSGVAKLHLDNIVSVFDGKDSSIRSTKTIPYLSQQNNVDGNLNVSTNRYDYKDVGTMIDLTNVTVTDDSLYFQSTFKYEQILNDSITPSTSKREVVNYLRIPSGQSVLISGIKSDDSSRNYTKIPILGDIPYLGSLFRFETKNQKNETFAIYLENLSFNDENSSKGFER